MSRRAQMLILEGGRGKLYVLGKGNCDGQICSKLKEAE